MTFSDQEILYRVKHGDETAFGSLRTHFSPSAFKFCNVLLKDENEARSIIYKVFDEIWKKRDTINEDHDFQLFLFCSLRNHIFERLKQYNTTAPKTAYLERILASRDCE